MYKDSWFIYTSEQCHAQWKDCSRECFSYRHQSGSVHKRKHSELFIMIHLIEKEKNDNESVKARIAFLKNKFKGQKVIIGVDRLDYIKGIPQKLHGFEIFLETHPEWTDKIVFIQVGVPSRYRF